MFVCMLGVDVGVCLGVKCWCQALVFDVGDVDGADIGAGAGPGICVLAVVTLSRIVAMLLIVSVEAQPVRA